ncbi:hypothetical protein TSOC_013337 [Tetrabaena socialis]|uniref:Uncharacterized protein n=1 Tax=Tetrabaena socialis TaxID=47790 RepID=A0A2J7ZKL8_9CHLO|nr:hypothetical protein TSOC_013337 [Tetrabaena socialis]|eukprot:PNH00818.1 hypothetical protein TSOC_013337 [Tetrabaena socialis]
MAPLRRPPRGLPSEDPLIAQLCSAQAVVYQDRSAVGRLVRPRLDVEPSGPHGAKLVSLVFDFWQPVDASARKLGPEVIHLRIPVDEAYRASAYSLAIFAPAWAFQLGQPTFSGRETAAAVSQHQQRLAYIRQAQRKFEAVARRDSPDRHPPARSDAEFTIETGGESLSLTYNTAAEPAWLQRISVKLLGLPKVTVDDSGGPAGHTSAAASTTRSGAGCGRTVAMASASTEAVPQAQSGQQQGSGKAAEQAQPQQQQQQPQPQQQGGTSTSGVVGASAAAAAADAGTTGAAASSAGPTEPAASAAGIGRSDVHVSGRRGGGSTGRSAASGEGASGEDPCGPDGSDASHLGGGRGGSNHASSQGGGGSGGSRNQAGAGSSGGADRGEPGRDGPPDARAQGAKAAARKQKGKREEAEGVEGDAAAGRTAKALEGLPGGARPAALCSLSDLGAGRMAPDAGSSLHGGRGAEAGLGVALEAGSRTSFEQHTGGEPAAEPKPTVKLIRDGAAGALGPARPATAVCVVEQDGTVGPVAAVVAAAHGQAACAGGGRGSQQLGLGDGAACNSRCCGGGGEGGEWLGGGGDGARASGRPDPPVAGDAPARAEPAPDATAMLAPAEERTPAKTSRPNVTLRLHPHPPPNGAWPSLQPKTAGSAAEQQQQQQPNPHTAPHAHANGPNVPSAAHPPQHPGSAGAHGPLPNGKVRNGEAAADAPSLLAQQVLLPYLTSLAAHPPQGPGGAGAPQQPPQQQQQQQQAVLLAGGHAAPHPNGLEAAILHQMLLAQQNGAFHALVSGQQLGGPPPQSLVAAGGAHGWHPAHQPHPQQQQQMQQAVAPAQQQQQQQLMQQAMHHHLLQQHLLQQVVQQQQLHHQQQQQQQQAMLQGLAQLQLAHAGAAAAAGADAAGAYGAAPAPGSSAAPEPAIPPSEQQSPFVPPSLLAPVAAPSPAAAAAAREAALQASWEAGSASSVRSEPSTATAPPAQQDRAMGHTHRVQSHGNMLAAAAAAGGGGGGGAGSRATAALRNRASFNGQQGPAGGSSGQLSGAQAGGGGAGGGGAPYGSRAFVGGGGGGGGNQRHSSGPHAFVRGGGGRYDAPPGGSADSSRPSSRGPNPLQHGGGGPRHPHSSADLHGPAESVALPDPKGACDLDRFISQIEPVIAIDPDRPPQQAIAELCMRDLPRLCAPVRRACPAPARLAPLTTGLLVRPARRTRGIEPCPRHVDANAALLFAAARGPSSEANSGRCRTRLPSMPARAAARLDPLTWKLYSSGRVWGKLVEALADVGYDSNSLVSMPYDWRLAMPLLEPGWPVGANVLITSSSYNVWQTEERTIVGVLNATNNGTMLLLDSPLTHPHYSWVKAFTGSLPTAASAVDMRAEVALLSSNVVVESAEPASSSLLYDMKLLDVHPASWFAVAWYPVYRIPDAPLYARFLTFHSFGPLVESMRNVQERLTMGQVAPYNILSLPLVGMNWYNMQGERWMEPLDESAVASGGPHAPPGAPGATPPLQGGSHPHTAASSPRVPAGRAPRQQQGTDVWYQGFLHNLQATADRLARGVGLRVLGQHGSEEVRLRVPDYEFFRARS